MNSPIAYSSTMVGSFPHQDIESIVPTLVEVLDIPVWPQLPRRNFRESMYVQFSPSLPSIVLDEPQEKVYFDTTVDITPVLEEFYLKYLNDEVEYFHLREEFASGFYSMLDELSSAGYSGHNDQQILKPEMHDIWVKGQVTGPISFGLTVTDHELRASLYHDQLADVIVKNMAMNARWQIQQLRLIRPGVIIFVDEPYMASFGSAFISVSRHQVIEMLNEVFDSIHAENALAGVHCCANTDWSVLLSTKVDILNIDACGYLKNLFLYPQELKDYLDRGGGIAWGIIPNGNDALHISASELVDRLLVALDGFEQKAWSNGVEIHKEKLLTRSLITPNCGLAATSVEIAERVIRLLREVSEELQASIDVQ